MHQIVVIGAGRIGRIHARNVALHPRLCLAGVADAVADSAAQVAGSLRSDHKRGELAKMPVSGRPSIVSGVDRSNSTPRVRALPMFW